MKPLILNKSEAFAVRIVNAYNYLVKQKHETVISKQLLRAGTSIQANIAEAQYAQSRPDFISKYNIALKEANETRNWINLLHNTGYIDQAAYDSIYDDINQIVIILISILRKLKGNSDNNNNG